MKEKDGVVPNGLLRVALGENLRFAVSLPYKHEEMLEITLTE
jgi:hypothetical protein